MLCYYSFEIFTQPIDAIDVTRVNLSCIYCINAVDVERVTLICRLNIINAFSVIFSQNSDTGV